jgi:hypothetical protein
MRQIPTIEAKAIPEGYARGRRCLRLAEHLRKKTSELKLAATVTMAIVTSVVMPGVALSGPPSFQSDVESAAKPWTSIPEQRTDTVRFAVVGDRTGLARPGVFEQAMLQISWMAPEFVINVGDLIEGYSDDPALTHQEWTEIDRAVAASKLPFFHVAGNHDLGTDAALGVWRQRYGRPYYSFEYKGALFLILDTEDPPKPMPPEMAAQFHAIAARMKTDPVATEQALNASLAKVNDQRAAKTDDEMASLNRARLSAAQITWANGVLAQHRAARWTFVLLHKPAWTTPGSGFAEIEAALGARPYTVIAGHNHFYKREQRHGRDYLTIGTSGGISHQEGKGKMDHIAWVTLGDDPPSIALVKLRGILDRDGESGQTLVR